MTTLLVPALVGLAGIVSVMISAMPLSADMVVRSPYFERELRTRAAKNALRSSAGTDPDTVWIGHVNTTTGLPGAAGGYGPHHIGRGPNRPIGGLLGTAAAFDGIWDFDHFQGGENDSLMGWWPIAAPFGSVGPSDNDDWQRSWFGLDYGNQGNHSPVNTSGRTFGVLGYWHADNGGAPSATVSGSNPVSPGWTPLVGTKSMWCGLRSHGDLSYTDPITLNPFNSSLVDFQGNNSGAQTAPASASFTDHNFPGYGSQWDQLLYRDVTLGANLSGGQNVTYSFKYVTNMSELNGTVHSSQTGYFYFDPLKTVASGTDGNFISAAASAGGPVDSFMVYVGAPVEPVANTPPLFLPNDFVASDGATYDIFDAQRRWFSEVVNKNSYIQLLSASGIDGTPGAPIAVSGSLSATDANGLLDADGGASNGGRLRFVFRTKTNRNYDDENTGSSGFSSGGQGAAILDDVVIGGPSGTLLSEGFEGTGGGVDNAVGTPATSAWKATGKPPGAWFHLHNTADGLPFDDPCGAVAASVRLCNMGNAVLSPGNHDLGDKSGGIFGSNFENQQKYVVSPTVNMVSSGVGVYNDMGIDQEIAARKSILLSGDQLYNLYDYSNTGNGFRYGWQSYPATQGNGVKCWGEMRKTAFFFSSDVPGCFEGVLDDGFVNQLIQTTNGNGVPDSLRIYIESMSRCFTLPLTSTQCSPASGSKAGGYFDNISIGFATAPPPPTLAANIWDFFNDCFPVNDGNKPVNAFGMAYDTLAANIRTAYNTSNANTKNAGSAEKREVIPGDTCFVGANGNNVRVDLVFRILPGVGNYVSVGNRASGVARRPDVRGAGPGFLGTAAAAGDVTLPNHVDRFWGAYMADNGAFGTGGNGSTGPGHAGGWDPNRWNSARCDTVENNYFPVEGVTSNIGELTPAHYMTAYHESDPKFTVLGIAKNRCFLHKNSGQINFKVIDCYDQVADLPAWALSAASGFNQAENGLTRRTYEYTKMLPDGQFTPGAQIQYFFRKSFVGDPITAYGLYPDTNFVFPSDGGDYFDFHRWREVAVLPDRWKDPGFAAGGTGMACMLVIDLGDRRGDEGTWVAIADSIGLTSASKRGSHNGFRARPDQDFVGVNVGGDDTISRRDNGGQAGSLWDLYETTSGESNTPAGRIGSRGAYKETGAQSATVDKWSTHGPSADMMNNYREVVLLASDLGPDAIGPLPNQTDDDIGLITNFLLLPGGATQPRGMIMMGYRLGDGMWNQTGTLGSITHQDLMQTYFRASLRNSDYRQLSTNTNDVADLLVQPVVGGAVAPQTYGFGNQCFLNNDVFNALTPPPAGAAGTLYENVGGAGPYVASVFATNSGGGRPYRTLINGWTLGLFGGGFGTETTLLNVGARKYWYDVLTTAFGGLSCQPTGTPVGVGDSPGSGAGSSFVNFMNLRSSNPMRSGEARIAFGVTKTEKVEVKVYDVTGRMVKTVSNRVFAGGQEHVVTWDGTDEVGNRVKSGVYFYQLKTANWTSQKKLAVLSN